MIRARMAFLPAAQAIVCCVPAVVFPQADRWQSTLSAGEQALKQNHYTTADKLLRQALRQAEQSGGDQRGMASALKLLGDLYFAEKKYDEAKSFYDRSEGIQSASNQLPWAKQALDGHDYKDAERIGLEALRNLEKMGSQSSYVVPALNLLGEVYRAQRKFGQAETVLTRAVQVLLRSSGQEGAELASTLNLLGEVYDDQAKFAEAAPVLLRALTIRKKVLSPDDPKLGESLSSIAEHYQKSGRASEAEIFLQQAANIREKSESALREYVDKANGFRLGVPQDWRQNKDRELLPGALVDFENPDGSMGISVTKRPLSVGEDPALLFDAMKEGFAKESKGEILSEENSNLSGLPARKLACGVGAEPDKGRLWMITVVTKEQSWSLVLGGANDALSSPMSPKYKAAQTIVESFLFLEPVLSQLKASVVTPPPPVESITVDEEKRQHYSNREVGITVLLPEGWKKVKDNTSSFQQGKTVVLGLPGTLALVVLTRERLEASHDLYVKLATKMLAQGSEDYRQVLEKKSSGRTSKGPASNFEQR